MDTFSRRRRDMSTTSALRELRKHHVQFSEHEYRYEEHGGTRAASQQLAVDEHAIVKTLVMEDDASRPLLMLMHGDREVSTKQLARQIGRRAIRPCDPEVAQRHTGYLVGGTSPFGTRKALPVFVERSILDLPAIYINGGRRGLLVRLASAELTRVLGAVAVDAAVPGV
jgi:Cys-tRNA(Pro) deacylase